jgi:ABC-type amino acid transport substrate-binding protein
MKITGLVLIATLLSPLSFAKSEAIKIATSADSYPYNFGVAEGCQSPSGVCGFEVELFDHICVEMALICEWKINPWSTIFDNLLSKAPDGNFSYDAVVASAEATLERKRTMLFSQSYFTAWFIFVGKSSLDIRFEKNGYPSDVAGQRLKIATWDGNLYEEMVKAYGGISPQYIQLLKVDNPVAALQRGEVDLIFVFTGIEMNLVKNKQFSVKGNPIKAPEQNLSDGVGAATRISRDGKLLQQKFSEGLVRVRQRGIYRKLAEKWLGRDIWDCKHGPQINDPFCAN